MSSGWIRIEIEQLAEQYAGTGSRVRGQRKGVFLQQQRSIGVIGDHKSCLLGGRYLRGACRRGVFTRKDALVGMLAKAPKRAAHGQSGHQQYRE
jgi:hypothetical protein